MNSKPAKPKHLLRVLLSLAALAAINCAVVWPLYKTEYIPYLGSVEGAFVAYVRYLQQHHYPIYQWFSMWRSGFPQMFVYQLGVFVPAAMAADFLHWSPIRAYHLITASGYAAGGLAMFFLAFEITKDIGNSFWTACLYSVFSPSALIERIGNDIGGLFHDRRLQVLAVYGEGPNVTGLSFAMLAWALLLRDRRERTNWSLIAAAGAIAAVMVINWPSTVALFLGIGALVVSEEAGQIFFRLRRVALIVCLAYAFAMPLALPSTMLHTFVQANVMLDSPVRNTAYYLSIFGITAAVLLVRYFLIARKELPETRFAVVFAVTLVSIVCLALRNILVLPQALRFHVAAEIPLMLLAGIALQRFLRWTPPKVRIAATAALALAVGILFVITASYARDLIREADVRSQVEFREANAFGRTAPHRVYAPGSVSLWMNAFVDIPQLTGCCDQSEINPVGPVMRYIITSGIADRASEAEATTAWLKAFAVDAVGVSGPNSREVYKDVRHPDKFKNFPLSWREDDDAIYLIPERKGGIARVVRSLDVITAPPVNGTDLRQLTPFVHALDDATLPDADSKWVNLSELSIRTDLTEKSQVVSIAESYHPGWRAFVNGKQVPIVKDGIGLMVIKPDLIGPADVELKWSDSPEPEIALVISALCCCAFLGFAGRRLFLRNVLATAASHAER